MDAKNVNFNEILNDRFSGHFPLSRATPFVTIAGNVPTADRGENFLAAASVGDTQCYEPEFPSSIQVANFLRFQTAQQGLSNTASNCFTFLKVIN